MKILSRIILLANLIGPTLLVAILLWFGLLFSMLTGSIFLPVLLLLDYVALVGITILHLVRPRRYAFWLAILLAVPFYFGVARSEMFVLRSTSRARACVDPADPEAAKAACSEVPRDLPMPHVAHELARGLRNLDDPDRKLEVVTLLRDLDVRDDEEVDAALAALFRDSRTRPNGEKLAAAAFDAIRKLDTLGTLIRGARFSSLDPRGAIRFTIDPSHRAFGDSITTEIYSIVIPRLDSGDPCEVEEARRLSLCLQRLFGETPVEIHVDEMIGSDRFLSNASMDDEPLYILLHFVLPDTSVVENGQVSYPKPDDAPPVPWGCGTTTLLATTDCSTILRRWKERPR